MAEEKYTEEFLTSLSEEQLAELVASLSADPDAPDSTQRELTERLAAELERRKRAKSAPPPS